MKKQILAVCDTEAEYTRRFCEFVRKKDLVPFEIEAFTTKENLLAFCQEQEVDLLLISETDYDISIKEFVKGQIIVLRDHNQSNVDTETEMEQIYKYQSCDTILQEAMCYYTNHSKPAVPVLARKSGMKMIGLYTPVHRSLQTTFGFTLGQILGKEHKVLYINFESFSGFGKLLDKEFTADLSDLIYYVSHARDVLFYKLKGMIETVQNMDFIPPAFSYMDINQIRKEQWLDMFLELEKNTSYEYLILDLSDNMQGLLDILRSCEKIFTIVKNDGMAIAKIDQYEKLLMNTEYTDILDKTKKFQIPIIHRVPFHLEQMTYGELADFIRGLIKEEFNGRY